MEGRGSQPYFDPDYDSLVERINPWYCSHLRPPCLVRFQFFSKFSVFRLNFVIVAAFASTMRHVRIARSSRSLHRPLLSLSCHRFRSLVSGWKGTRSTGEVRTCLGKLLGAEQLASEYPAIEITATDRPGLLSEIAAVLAELHCHVACAHAWTHNSRAAVILYVTDEPSRTPIADADRLAHIEQQVDSVVEAHHGPGERRRVKVSGPTPGRVHTERRLHQLMYEDGDYEAGPPPPPVNGDHFANANLEARRGNILFLSSPSSSSSSASSAVIKTRASIDSWKKRGYSVVNIQSRDRPKLLFDTVCTLTDMQYVVFHAAVGSHGPLAVQVGAPPVSTACVLVYLVLSSFLMASFDSSVQEYYIRHMDGCTLDSERDRQKVSRCLVAAVERRVSHGLRLDVSARDRRGLLSDVTRVLRENSLSLTRAECATRGERAVGTFYVTDASGGGDVDPTRVNAVRQEMGESVTVEVSNDATREWISAKSTNNGSSSSSSRLTSSSPGGSRSRSMTSLGSSIGSLLWSHIERLSSNFGSIRS
ncbi:hypothetical protein B296_00004010 [Ensete ventricosum]|uniref:ACT domain-containing protein ACR n=1 Tax=Ensete ventricosum TaxID=4639 RepID=A0A427B8S3_ENSVE|nr:hypothetical protein B296_00004010 [Ensete ventricosum]